MNRTRRMALALAIFAGWLVSAVSGRAFGEGMLYPLSAAVADSGTVFVADLNLPGVWKIENGRASVYFQASKKFRTPLNAVRCVAFDHLGNLLAGDSATREVYRFDKAGQPIPLTDGGIGIPMDIAVDQNGHLYVADLELHRIWKVPQAGGKPTAFAEVRGPRGLFVDAKDQLWIIAHGDNQLLRATPSGEVEAVVQGRPFNFPHDVVVDADGAAYVTDGYERAVWKIAPGEQPKPLVQGEPLVNPVGLTRQGESLLVVDPRAQGLFQVNKEGMLTRVKLQTSPSER